MSTTHRRSRLSDDPQSSLRHRQYHRSKTFQHPTVSSRNKLLSRSPSFSVLPSTNGKDIPNNVDDHAPPPLRLPQLCTRSDSMLPSLPPLPSSEERKVVVNVTVEGSSGPLKALLKLGATVEETIDIVVEQYKREGRKPKINPKDVPSFQLHSSYFSLHCLNKSDKIGESSGRNFYLRTSEANNNLYLGNGEEELTLGTDKLMLSTIASEIEPFNFFLAFLATRLNKIGRATRKIWKLVARIVCV